VFTLLMQKKNGREKLVYVDGDIEWEPTADGGIIVADGNEYPLASGDRAFVMNADGQTVQRYGRR
jgi:2-hydroxychromene-2-carboxylate isomerase